MLDQRWVGTMNVASWEDENLETFGDYPALVSGGRTWTSREVHEASTRFAGALADLGLAPGDRLALQLPIGFDLTVAFTAVVRAGGVPVILHHRAPPAEVSRVLTHCAPKGLFAGGGGLLASPPEARTLPIRIAMDASGAELPSGWRRFEQVLSTGAPLSQAVSREDTDPAQLVYTSGTTGTPKGVVYTHGEIAARYPFRKPAGGAIKAGPFVRLVALPPAHALGGSFLFLRLISKSTLVCLESFEPRSFLSAVDRHRVTTTVLVPSMCEALLAEPENDAYDLSSLRTIVVGGAPVSDSLIERFRTKFRKRLTVTYGLTEVPGITFGSVDPKPGSVGRLPPAVDVRFVDAGGRPVPVGETGEIQLKSHWVSALYRPGESAPARGSDDEWFSTGDVGYLDADRELYVTGRTKELIVQGGVKIAPREVADVVLRLGVRDCAVVGLPHPLLGEEAVACVELGAKSRIGEEQILAHCRAYLDRRTVPTSVLFFAALPKTELGKVKLGELREAVIARRAAVVETAFMRRLSSALPAERLGLVREAVATQVLRALRLSPRPDVPSGIDGRATFGELGLDSLAMVELAHGLGSALGRPVPATLPFDHPTIDGACDALVGELFASTEPRRTLRCRRPTGEPVAIVGIGCRLPGSEATLATADAFWASVRDGVDSARIVPAERWNVEQFYDPERGSPGKTYTRHASFLDDVDRFDADFFGVTPSEAKGLDPQHRLLLEVSWQALEHAGQDPRALSQRPTGVFVGITGSTYPSANFLGVMPCMAPGRVSQFLNLRGPSLAVDTACSSSLVAIHLAVQALRNRECDVALAGGVNVMTSPRPFVYLSAIQALAADGRCKAFDIRADGYGRGEGCVVLVLKPLSIALDERDRIIAVIRGSAVCHDGQRQSLTAPNGAAQQAVIRAALEDAGVEPFEIDYLEAHGTGTPLGDPIEVRSALAVLDERRDRPLVIGSVKTNIGHVEAAAGASALAKVALSLEHAEIPPLLHLTNLNPLLEPLASSFRLPTAREAWPRVAGRRRLAGVTSLGFSGTNAHVVVEERPDAAQTPERTVTRSSSPQLLPLSARTPEALVALAQAYIEHFDRGPTQALADVCFTASVGRAHHRCRAAVVAANSLSAREGLLSYVGRAVVGGNDFRTRRRPKLAFLFTGQGSQYVGMGRRLCETQPAFRQALERCAGILAPMLPRPLLEVLCTDAVPAGAGPTLDDAALAQPVLFAFEWSLAQLWRSWGVEPDLVLGHSLGEYVAACVAGLFSLEHGLRLVAERGRMTQTLTPPGAMLALRATEARAGQAIASHRDRVAIAAVNGREATVISGASEAIAEIDGALTLQGVAHRRLAVAHAYHSPLMDPLLDAWERVVSGVTFVPPRLPLVSTLTGTRVSYEELSRPEYWRRHLREPVQFASGVDSLLAEGCDAYLEIGPQPVLAGMARQHLGERADGCAWLPSLRRDRDEPQQLLESLGELYVRGVDPHWRGLYEHDEVRRVVVPGYPFQRASYWSVPLGGAHEVADPGRRQTPAGTRHPVKLAETFDERTEELTRHLRQIVAQVLGRTPDSLPRDGSLLELGLDSLRIMEVLSGLREAVDLSSTPAEFFARPTLAGFAATLAAKVTSGAPVADTS